MSYKFSDVEIEAINFCGLASSVKFMLMCTQHTIATVRFNVKPILLPPTSTVTPAQKLKAILDKDVAEETAKKPRKSRRTVCTFCTNSTKGVCRCKRPLCGPCADEETGLCPHCADDAA